MARNSLTIDSGWVAILVAVSLFGGLVLLGYFLSLQVGSLSQVEQALATARRQKADLSHLENLVTTLGTDKQTVDHYFVTTDTLPVFIESLESLAGSTKVNFDLTGATVSTDNPTGVTPSLVRLTFTARAPFPKLFQFLSLVDSLPDVVVVEQGMLATRQVGEWEGAFTIDVMSAPTIEQINAKTKRKK